MGEFETIVVVLAGGTFLIRLTGALVGQRLPRGGPLAEALEALPGSLIVALVTVSLLSGGRHEWIAAFVAALVAVLTRNLPLTMVAGILAVWLQRQIY